MDIETLITNYSSYIYNFALRLCCHPITAEDLAQETFIQAWNHLSSLREPSAAKSWLRKICLNQFLMRQRKNGEEIFLTDSLLETLENDASLFQSTSPSPEEEVLVAESIHSLQNGCFLSMARKLTLHQRLAFSMIDMFGLSLSETAELIGVSEKATKGLLYRARMNLDSFFHHHCNLLNVKNPCSCSAWIEFSKTRASRQRTIQHFKPIKQLDYTQSGYTFSPEIRAKIHYLYAHMPDTKPSESWYEAIIALLQTRAVSHNGIDANNAIDNQYL